AADLLRTPTPEVLSPPTQALVQQLQNLEFGTWFEFIQRKESRRLKLSWFSPTSHNYVFVDRSGLRLSVKPIEALAEAVDPGLARIRRPRAGAPLVARAPPALVRRLHRCSGRPPDAAQGPGPRWASVAVRIATGPYCSWRYSSGIPGSALAAWPVLLESGSC